MGKVSSLHGFSKNSFQIMQLTPPPLKTDKVAAVMYLDFCGKLAELLLHCSLVVWAAPTL